MKVEEEIKPTGDGARSERQEPGATRTGFTSGALLAAGYREHPPSFPHKGAAAFFQKAVRRETGEKRYFINVDMYRFPDRIGWQMETQLTLKDGKTIDVTLHPVASIEEMEEFFERLFVQMDAADYDG